MHRLFDWNCWYVPECSREHKTHFPSNYSANGYVDHSNMDSVPMTEFHNHNQNSYLRYPKSIVDCLKLRTRTVWRFEPNHKLIEFEFSLEFLWFRGRTHNFAACSQFNNRYSARVASWHSQEDTYKHGTSLNFMWSLRSFRIWLWIWYLFLFSNLIKQKTFSEFSPSVHHFPLHIRK